MKRHHVAARCRLSDEEERRILAALDAHVLVGTFHGDLLHNRASALEVPSSEGEGSVYVDTSYCANSHCT